MLSIYSNINHNTQTNKNIIFLSTFLGSLKLTDVYSWFRNCVAALHASSYIEVHSVLSKQSLEVLQIHILNLKKDTGLFGSLCKLISTSTRGR